MTTDFDPRTRIVLSWLREEAHENAEQMLLRALDEVDATPQRRSWPAWRSDRMNSYVKFIVAAAAVLVVAFAGYQLLPSNSGVGGEPAIEPSPSPSLLARGTFTAHGITAELDATGSGADVAGTMALSQGGTDNRATVDLECAQTTANGLIEIGGLLTESAWDPNAQDWNDGFPEGRHVVVMFEPGSPVKAVWWASLAEEEPIETCAALFEKADATGVEPGSAGLDPIQGTVEFGS